MDGLELYIPREKSWMVCSYISRVRRLGWFGAIYPEGEELDGLQLDIYREKGWMVWSHISRVRRVGWFGAK